MSNMVVRNSADMAVGKGGGQYSDQSYINMVNNTLTANQAALGGAVYGRRSNFDVRNTILWNNTATNGKEAYLDSTGLGVVFDIDYSDLQGGQASVTADPSYIIN